MDDQWVWVYLGVQALQTLQTIALRREVQRTTTSMRPPPQLEPETLQLPTRAQPPLWRSWMPQRERDKPRG